MQCTPTSAKSFVLKRKSAGQATGPGASPAPSGAATALGIVSATLQSAPSLTSASKVPSRPGLPQPAPRQGHIDAASLAILRVMCLAAKQLLGLVGAIPKWTNVWIVLEDGDGSVTSPFCGNVINCAPGKGEPTQGGEFCKDWWAFRGGKEGPLREAKAAAAYYKGSEKSSDAAGAGGSSGRGDGDGVLPSGDGKDRGGRQKGGEGNDEAGDAASSGSTV